MESLEEELAILDQLLSLRVSRAREYLLGGGAFDFSSLMHHQNSISKVGDGGEIMRDEEQGEGS